MPAEILWPGSLAQVLVPTLARAGCEPRGAEILPQGRNHVREWWAPLTTAVPPPSPLDIDSCFSLSIYLSIYLVFSMHGEHASHPSEALVFLPTPMHASILLHCSWIRGEVVGRREKERRENESIAPSLCLTLNH
jgi:hypothetical protein